MPTLFTLIHLQLMYHTLLLCAPWVRKIVNILNEGNFIDSNLIMDNGRFKWCTLCSKFYVANFVHTAIYTNSVHSMTDWQRSTVSRLRHALSNHSDCKKWYGEMKNTVWRCCYIWLLPNVSLDYVHFYSCSEVKLIWCFTPCPKSSAQLQIRNSRSGHRTQWVPFKNPFLMWK